MRRSRRLALAGALILARPGGAAAGTCALCRQVLASGGSAGLVQGFYWSIVLMAGLPLAILGAVGVLAWRHRGLRAGRSSSNERDRCVTP